MTIGDGSRAGSASHLDSSSVLKNRANLRQACEFVIDRALRRTDPAMAIIPGTVDAFIERIGEVRDGAIVYVRSTLLAPFFDRAFALIRKRFVLVTGGSDWASPAIHRHTLDNPKIIRWFGENCDLTLPHPKFEPIPLGVADVHSPHGNQAVLMRLHSRMPPVVDKPLVAHSSFHLKISHPTRRQAYAAVRELAGVSVQARRAPPELLWIRHANHAFEISPSGAGPDCHRTWEALLLRTIPIVKSSTLDPLYRQFPVAIVKDWREITPATMASWRNRFKDCFTLDMFTRLTRDHWVKRIRDAAGASA
jgi:hypothetical protein